MVVRRLVGLCLPLLVEVVLREATEVFVVVRVGLQLDRVFVVKGNFCGLVWAVGLFSSIVAVMVVLVRVL